MPGRPRWEGDPVEATVARALQRAGYQFEHEKLLDPDAVPPSRRLDFYIPMLDLWIECKQFSSERTTRQLHGLTNVILIQGMAAAKAFEQMIYWRVR